MNLHRKGRAALVLALVAVVGMAFRVSWNALRDIAGAVGADGTAAMLYPFVVDGLMALALIATLVLTGHARTFALRVLGAYTLASLVLNYVHGLVPELHGRIVDWGRLADWDPANWALVLLATSLPVGSIYFGSDLVAKVLHHRPSPIPTATTNAEESSGSSRERSTSDLPVSTPATVVLTRLSVPDPAPVDLGKSGVGVKSMPVVVPMVKPVPIAPASARSVPASSAVPRRATGRVPVAAKSTRTRRTPEQLMAEARKATTGLTDAEVTGEGIRRALRTSPAKARMLRDALLAERATGAVTP
ncbi:DUF2637 domain-containing protein [Streptomyces sp. MUM 2J]|uniref:DUF2637 domain-containing protein n=1 Tax=Streptomyces sp. MUM 2J TaxID=2791987 RepID=UPI001F03ACED|nr:DUF2637 domain-containing protein [Streptomyces sp. MUM 2J]MCH0563254.1 DUF2637 domain-containing protein [Streptomyces sp. MUM 2J]